MHVRGFWVTINHIWLIWICLFYLTWFFLTKPCNLKLKWSSQRYSVYRKISACNTEIWYRNYFGGSRADSLCPKPLSLTIAQRSTFLLVFSSSALHILISLFNNNGFLLRQSRTKVTIENTYNYYPKMYFVNSSKVLVIKNYFSASKVTKKVYFIAG